MNPVAVSSRNTGQERDMGLYVHVPFCASRCGYCTFTSSLYDKAKADAYLEALKNELSLRRVFSTACSPSTLFIGGGTPSSLSTGQLEQLLALLPVPGGGEATCELNPDSASDKKLDLLKHYGINRCSFGIQSFSGEGLRVLQRRHSASRARTAVTNAVEKGFHSVSADIIMGWPGQTREVLLDDLRQALDLGISHLSCYQLIVEEGSGAYERYKKLLSSTTDTEERELWDGVETFLASRGFEHYETSNFALPGFRCRHNVDIWKGGEYMGIGVAAHSHCGGRRFANTDDMGEYLAVKGDPEKVEVFSEMLNPEDKAKECAVFWLRLFDGVDLGEFRKRTGFDFTNLYANILPGLLHSGIMERYRPAGLGDHVRVAGRYQPVLDAILVDFI